MGNDGRRMRWGMALLGTGLALMASGCARSDGAETAAVAEPPPLLADSDPFGAAEPAGVRATDQTPEAPLLYDPAQGPEAPPRALPLAEL